MEKRYPIFFVGGGDGAGKTTQTLLMASFLRKEHHIQTAYVSFPIYDTEWGRTIGRGLGRWGSEQAIDMPSPEDMACLFALNRLETLHHLKRLSQMGYLPICNRGPYDNLFGVAKQVLDDEVNWETLPADEKIGRVNEMMVFDEKFLGDLGAKTRLVHLFLSLDPEEARGLAAEKALATLGGEPDRHEERIELQLLTTQIYQEIADGKIHGHKVEVAKATRGSVRRMWETPWPQENMEELDGILETAREVASVIFPHLWGRRMTHEFWTEYAVGIPTIAVGLWRDSKTEVGVDFELREVLGLPKDLGRSDWDNWDDPLDVRGDRFADKMREGRPGVLVAIEASKRLDRTMGIPRMR